MTLPNGNPEKLEQMLVAAEEAGDQHMCDEIMLLLYAVAQTEAIKLHEAMKSGEYPSWLYEVDHGVEWVPALNPSD